MTSPSDEAVKAGAKILKPTFGESSWTLSTARRILAAALPIERERWERERKKAPDAE